MPLSQTITTWEYIGKSGVEGGHTCVSGHLQLVKGSKLMFNLIFMQSSSNTVYISPLNSANEMVRSRMP